MYFLSATLFSVLQQFSPKSRASISYYYYIKLLIGTYLHICICFIFKILCIFQDKFYNIDILASHLILLLNLLLIEKSVIHIGYIHHEIYSVSRWLAFVTSFQDEFLLGRWLAFVTSFQDECLLGRWLAFVTSFQDECLLGRWLDL